MNRGLLRQIVVIVATVATITLNILANALPLNGLNTGEISDRFKVYFVPAGYVFAIWFVIYVGMIAYTVFQALPSQRDNLRLISIAPWYIVSSVANMVWLLLWHYEIFELTLLAMLVLLVSLIVIYLRLDIGRTSVPANEMWTTHVTFSIYLGWITVATIANTTQLLYYLGWSGWGIGPEVWAAIMLAAGAIIATLMSLTRADIAFSLVLVWAYIGVALKFPDVAAVSITAWVSVVFILIVTVAGYVGKSRRLKGAAAS